MPDEMLVIAKRLKSFRESARQSQFEASREIGISLEELGKLERGGTDPRLSTLCKIASYLGVGLPALIAPEQESSSVYGLLSSLGITSNYIGYFQTAQAVELCAAAPEKLTQITKLVYSEVGKRYRSDWTAVERNIRTVAKLAYRRKPEILEKLMGFTLAEQPKSAEFIAALTARVILGPPSLEE